MKRNFFIFYLSTVLFIFVFSLIYEFLIEEGFNLFHHGEEATYLVETAAVHWEYVFTITIFSAFALILPTAMAYKNNIKFYKAETANLKLQIQLDEMLTKLLSGFVGICCVCKKVRVEDKDKKLKTWESVEHYISKRTDLEFTHCYCPDCFSQTQQSYRKTD